MTDTASPRGARDTIPTDVNERRADILRIGNRAAAAVQASNRQRGIANWYSLRGYLVSDMPLVADPAATRQPASSA